MCQSDVSAFTTTSPFAASDQRNEIFSHREAQPVHLIISCLQAPFRVPLNYDLIDCRSVFVLAPILLLLNQDANLFTRFTDRQRYFPVTLTITLYLALSSGYHIVVGALQGGLASSLLTLAGKNSVIVFTIKNALLLFVTLPNQVLFNTFMWDNVKQSNMMLVSLTPLNLPAVLLSDVSTVRVLAALGVAFALVQFLVSRRVRLAGLKYI